MSLSAVKTVMLRPTELKQRWFMYLNIEGQISLKVTKEVVTKFHVYAYLLVKHKPVINECKLPTFFFCGTLKKVCKMRITLVLL